MMSPFLWILISTPSGRAGVYICKYKIPLKLRTQETTILDIALIIVNLVYGIPSSSLIKSERTGILKLDSR